VQLAGELAATAKPWVSVVWSGLLGGAGAATASLAAHVIPAPHRPKHATCSIVLSRAKHDPATRAYLERRIREGKTRREAMRSLKRHLSRTSITV
jgi:hypothetical protein